MISADEVSFLYSLLFDHNIQVWLTGGWGIDALLGEQARLHKDLDVLVLLNDVIRLRQLLEKQDYSLKEFWSENLFERDKLGEEVATAFVLRDHAGRELDVHAIRLDEEGNGIPAWQNDEGLIFRERDLRGQGRIVDLVVRCITPQMQLACHKGYELPEEQVGDLERLKKAFGGSLPRLNSLTNIGN